MATKIFMEALSPTMEEGRLVKWLKNEGDKIASGDVLGEVETDKAIMELVARGDGVLRKRFIGEGDTSPVGTVIGVIAAADEDIDELVAQAGGGGGGGGGEAAASAAEVVAAEEVAAPAAAPAAVPSAGPPPGKQDTAAEPDVQDQTSAAPAKALPAPATPVVESGDRPRSSPLARRLASEGGLDLGNIKGSGPAGRIIKRDVESAMAAGVGAAAKPGAVAVQASESDYTDVALTQMRKTIARRLGESIGPIPTFYLTADLDMERVTEMRAAMAAMGAEYKVSFNDIVLKAVAVALSRHPEVNAQWLGDRIRQHHRVHIGMAVAIDDGLITPVIFDADRKRLSEISVEARELAGRARDRKLKPEEFTGSTFSVSNLGMFGIDHFTAIINPPEVAILAIGAVADRPVVVDGQVLVRKRMNVTMSCDHRVVDGALGAKFLQTLRQLIENPLMLVY